MSDPRYPIGRFERRDVLTPQERQSAISQIADVPKQLREAVRGLTDKQLDEPYRDGGWSLRQVVHHLPDSHMNAFIRLKLALTEESPFVKPYDESKWALLADAHETPVETSLALLENLHERWLIILRSLKAEDFARTMRHPEHGGTQTVDWLLAMYSWHGRHHIAQINSTRERLGI